MTFEETFQALSAERIDIRDRVQVTCEGDEIYEGRIMPTDIIDGQTNERIQLLIHSRPADRVQFISIRRMPDGIGPDAGDTIIPLDEIISITKL